MSAETALSAPVTLHRDGPVAELTVGTGRGRNALSAQGWRAISLACRKLAVSDDLRLLLVRGAGDTFCAGSDIRQWQGAAPDEVAASFAAMEDACSALEQLPAPVVAVIEGVAAGAGCQLALACDLQLLASSARIGMPIARLGILVSRTFAGRLVTLAGPAVARDLLYTGRLLNAPEALAAGLATRVVADDQLDGEVRALVAQVVAQPVAATRAAKIAVNDLLRAGRQQAALSEADVVVAPEDFDRGIRAFLQGRSGGPHAAAG